MKVFNSYAHLVSLAITDGTVVDGIHVQPMGRVTLPKGFRLTQNSAALNPNVRVQLEETDVVDVPTPKSAVHTSKSTVKQTDNTTEKTTAGDK